MAEGHDQLICPAPTLSLPDTCVLQNRSKIYFRGDLDWIAEQGGCRLLTRTSRNVEKLHFMIFVAFVCAFKLRELLLIGKCSKTPVT